jgi:hypothetical protein
MNRLHVLNLILQEAGLHGGLLAEHAVAFKKYALVDIVRFSGRQRPVTDLDAEQAGTSVIKYFGGIVLPYE